MSSQTKFFMLILLTLRYGVNEVSAQSLGTPITTTDQKEKAGITSQSEVATPLPNLILFPWQTPSIDADLLRQTKTARAETLAIIKRILAPNAVSLESIAPKKPKMETARYMLKDVLADANSTLSSPLAVLPLWARLHDHDLFALVIVDSKQNTLKSMIHRILPRERWEESVRNKNFNAYFEPGFTEISTSLNLANLISPSEDASLGIRDQTASPRTNEIDRMVLTLILGNSLLPDFTVINPVASELMTTIHRFYGLQGSMRKANRELMTRFIYDKVPVKIKLPQKLTLTIGATDGVFGQTLSWSWSEPFTIGVKPDNTLDITISDRLKTELASEKSSLRRDELPQIAKIKGAWAYVDKGRAWGLKMNDRLVGSEQPNAFKGHVVAYFGPELKLKSPRGWPINEGAIIFIRKGQKNLKIGQAFTYDGMRVPTSWPPTNASAKP